MQVIQQSSALGLSELADNHYFTEPLVLNGSVLETLLFQLQAMLLIRRTEEVIAELVISKEARCPCHLGIGQEAIAVGVSQHLLHTDRVFSNHRSHAHYLALGGTIESLFAEILGKVTGCSKGFGGSMHLLDKSHGFWGSLPIVGGTVPIAVGAALAAKMDGGQDIAVSYFGDGTAEEGIVHESLNLASIKQLPILFICENNLYSSHLDITLRQPSDRVARFADAHHIEAVSIDGNDIVAVSDVSQALIEKCRKQRQPAFLEVVTYRWRGHVGPSEDIDVGVRRKPEDLAAWKQRDPIRRLKDALIQADQLSEELFIEMRERVEFDIMNALERARSAPYPEVSNLTSHVYKAEVEYV